MRIDDEQTGSQPGERSLHDGGKPMESNLRKAAILIAGLERGAVDALLKGLSPDESRRLRRAVVSLGEVSPEEQDAVTEEFLHHHRLPPAARPTQHRKEAGGGVELSLSSAHAPSPLHGVPSAPPGRGNALGFLDEAEADVLVELLRDEQPQTVALVVSRLDADRAARVLSGLPADVREHVLKRLVDINEVDPVLVAEIAEHFRRGLRERQAQFRRRAEGVRRVSRIMAAVARESESLVADGTSSRFDAPRTRAVAGGRGWSIKDLCALDDLSLATILGDAGPETVELALLVAPAELVHRVLRRLPAGARRALSRRLRDLGPTSLRDVEEARRRLLATAEALENQGRISRGTPHVSVAV